MKRLSLAFLLIFLSLSMSAQMRTFSGIVINKATGLPIEFATVHLKGTSQWAIADAQGRFVIKNVQDGKNTVEISCLGYVTDTKDIIIGMGEDEISGYTERELKEDSMKIVGKAQAQGIMVDGLGVGDVGNIVLRDRQHLSENGLLVVVLTLEKGSNMILSGPDIVSRGFVYVRESDELIDGAREMVLDMMERFQERNVSDWGKIKAAIKDNLGDYLWKKTKRRPMILPIIMEV